MTDGFLLVFTESLALFVPAAAALSFWGNKNRLKIISLFVMFSGIALGGTSSHLVSENGVNIVPALLKADLLIIILFLFIPLFFHSFEVKAGSVMPGVILTMLLFSVSAFRAAGVIFLLEETALLKGESFRVSAGGLLGFSAALVLLYLFAIIADRIISWRRFFNYSSLMVFTAALFLLSRSKIILSAESIVAKTVHDFFHWFIVIFVVPDHPNFRTELWNLLGVLMREKTNVIFAIGIMILPAVLMIVKLIRMPYPDVSFLKTGAAKRKIKAEHIKTVRCRMVPLLICIIAIASTAYRSFSSVQALYHPEPVPVTAENGIIEVPLKGPSGDFKDGSLHKLSYRSEQGDEILLLVINKPGDEISVTMDYCLICEPEGYCQFGPDLFCIYCGTPIPIDTVGHEGGCNPIPIPFEADSSSIKIPVGPVVETFNKYVK